VKSRMGRRNPVERENARRERLDNDWQIMYKSFMQKLLFAVALLSPSILLGQNPFDGTWKTIFDQSTLSPKPISFSVRKGIYDAFTAVPEIHVKADGQDQAVSGHPYNTVAVTEMDAHNVQIVYKKDGKTIRELTYTVTADGKTLTYKSKSHAPGSDQITTTEATMERVGEAPTGANASSGSWRSQKRSASANELLATYMRSADELTFSKPAGEAWTARLDGKDYPVKGSYSIDAVSLKQINGHEIEVSYKREGKLTEVDKITISTNGRKMTRVVESKLTGRVSIYVAEKQ
jgi:hypothetical protein